MSYYERLIQYNDIIVEQLASGQIDVSENLFKPVVDLIRFMFNEFILRSG